MSGYFPGRQYEGERGALPDFTLNTNLAFVQFNDLFHDRQSKSYAALLRLRTGLKSLKDLINLRGSNALAGILYPAFHQFTLVYLARTDLDCAVRSKLQRIRQEVLQYLCKQEFIAIDFESV